MKTFNAKLFFLRFEDNEQEEDNVFITKSSVFLSAASLAGVRRITIAQNNL